ncbi:hypothetical protein BC832DRAFT_590446 [Gaertneriomyces semiglobifer]|nr:hypothetical protein BC832DRAFT_590446 [Gaertneriomyces semiglobifer]
MFKAAFQGGPSFEIFSSQGSASSVLHWKLSSKSFIKRTYDPDLKGYCYSCEKLGKLSLPKDDKQSVYLIQPYLCLQVFVPPGQPFSLELCITDLERNHRRFFLSTAHRDVKVTALHVTLPLSSLVRGMWLNFCIDLISLVSDNFRGHSFRSLDTLQIGGTFRLRKVFTLSKRPPDTTGFDFTHPMDLPVEIPRNMDFPANVDHMAQIITMSRIGGTHSTLRSQCNTVTADISARPSVVSEKSILGNMRSQRATISTNASTRSSVATVSTTANRVSSQRKPSVRPDRVPTTDSKRPSVARLEPLARPTVQLSQSATPRTLQKPYDPTLYTDRPVSRDPVVPATQRTSIGDLDQRRPYSPHNYTDTATASRPSRPQTRSEPAKSASHYTEEKQPLEDKAIDTSGLRDDYKDTSETLLDGNMRDSVMEVLNSMIHDLQNDNSGSPTSSAPRSRSSTIESTGRQSHEGSLQDDVASFKDVENAMRVVDAFVAASLPTHSAALDRGGSDANIETDVLSVTNGNTSPVTTNRQSPSGAGDGDRVDECTHLGGKDRPGMNRLPMTGTTGAGPASRVSSASSTSSRRITMASNVPTEHDKTEAEPQATITPRLSSTPSLAEIHDWLKSDLPAEGAQLAYPTPAETVGALDLSAPDHGQSRSVTAYSRHSDEEVLTGPASGGEPSQSENGTTDLQEIMSILSVGEGTTRVELKELTVVVPDMDGEVTTAATTIISEGQLADSVDYASVGGAEADTARPSSATQQDTGRPGRVEMADEGPSSPPTPFRRPPTRTSTPGSSHHEHMVDISVTAQDDSLSTQSPHGSGTEEPEEEDVSLVIYDDAPSGIQPVERISLAELHAFTVSRPATPIEGAATSGSHSRAELIDSNLRQPVDTGQSEEDTIEQGPLKMEDFAGLSEDSEGENSLELVYDEELKCYYDPTTMKYYEINDPAAE